MNDKVQKIVDLLFADTVDSEETRAFREEVLNNCRERCEDLIAQGRTEDEALAAVAESLSGMEEALAPYRRSDPAEGAGDTVLSAEGVRAVRARLARFDLEVRPSGDGKVHFRAEGENAGRVTFRREGDALELWEEDDALVRAGHIFNWEGLSGFRDVRNFFRARRDMGGGLAVLSLPEGLCPDAELFTASGDVSWQGVSTGSLRAETASGDIAADCGAQRVELKAASGDVKWRGRCEALRAATTSGDVEIEGALREASVRTVSGDVSLDAESADARVVEARTVSGDVRVCLPDGAEASVQAHTVSGDVKTGVPSVAGALLSVKIDTVSGDIRVR